MGLLDDLRNAAAQAEDFFTGADEERQQSQPLQSSTQNLQTPALPEDLGVRRTPGVFERGRDAAVDFFGLSNQPDDGALERVRQAEEQRQQSLSTRERERIMRQKPEREPSRVGEFLRDATEVTDKIPETFLPFEMSTAREFVADALRSIPRSVTSVGLSAVGKPVAEYVTGEEVASEDVRFQPQGPFQEFFFGQEPVVGLRERAKRGGEFTTGVLESVGVEEDRARQIGGPLGGGGALALTGLDILDVGGLSKIGRRTIKEAAEGLIARYGDEAVSTLRALDEGDEVALNKLPSNVVGDVENTIRQTGAENLDNATSAVRQAAETARPQSTLSTIERLKRSRETRTKRRKSVETIADNPAFSKENKERVLNNTRSQYRQITNKETIDDAIRQINLSTPSELAIRTADNVADLSETQLRDLADTIIRKRAVDRVDVASARLISKALDMKGGSAIDKAVDLQLNLSEKLTETGQAVQAFSLFSDSSPSVAIRTADELVKRAWDKADVTQRRNMSEELTDSAKEAIKKQAKKTQKLVRQGKEGTREHVVEAAKLQSLIQGQIPKNAGQKLASLRFMNLLLVPDTFLRNLGGNIAATIGDVAASTPASVLDMAFSAVTGRRTAGRQRVSDLFRGARRGFKESVEDVREGIDTSRVVREKYTAVNSRGKTWAKFDPNTGKMEPTKILGKMEKALDFTLRVPDRVAFEAAFESATRDLMRHFNTDELTPGLAAEAMHTALRRTMQDKNALSITFQRLRKSMNKQSTLGFSSAFGAGEAFLSFAQTMGSLTVRSLEFTPTGLAFSMMDFAKPVLGSITGVGPKQMSRWTHVPSFAFEQDKAIRAGLKQRKLAQDIGRASVGTSMIAAGYVMGNLGIISGSGATQSEFGELEEKAGVAPYSINFSALRRFFMSGLDPEAAKPQDGDHATSYDWVEPMALPFAFGAELAAIDNNNSDGEPIELMNKLGEAALRLEGVITEKTVFRSIKQVADSMKFSQNGFFASLLQPITDLPATLLVPSIVANMRYMADPTLRDKWGEDNLTGFFNRGVYQIMDRIPGLSEKLPPRIDIFGEEEKITGDTLPARFFNTTINPSITRKIDRGLVDEALIELSESTGDMSAVPRKVTDKVDIPGVSGGVKLSPEQKVELQKATGQLSRSRFEYVLSNKELMSQIPEQARVDMLSQIESNTYNDLKYFPYLESIGVEIPDNVPLDVPGKIYKEIRETGDNREFWDGLSNKEKVDVLQPLLDRVSDSISQQQQNEPSLLDQMR